MPHNQTKVYNGLLEVGFLSERERTRSLRGIFDRDFNGDLIFRTKPIRPTKVDGQASLDTVFSHLTTREEKDEKGRSVGRRFEMARSIRLHWIKHHIDERSPNMLDIFSYEDRVNGKDVIRTYIFDRTHLYVIILEPHRSGLDYYILTAYHLNEPGGEKQIEKKSKNRLPDLY